MIRRLPILLVLALLLCAASALPAAATPGGDFEVTLSRPPLVAAANGEAQYSFAPSAQDTTMLVMHGATELDRQTSIAGNTRVSASIAALQSGDRVEIYRPALPAGPPGPGVTPIDQYVIPNLSVAGAAGATSVSGTAPDGALARVSVAASCDQNSDASLPVSAAGGAFSSPSGPLAAGVELTLYVFSGVGDSTAFRTAVPGETPCFSAYAYPSPAQPTLDPQAATPYGVGVNSLRDSVASTSRLVWKRAGAIIGDMTNAGNPRFTLTSATQPQPGDVLEVYRPQTAAAPSRSVTIPNVSATVDIGASLVAVDSTETAGLIDVFAADPSPSAHSSRRTVLAPPPGRTLFDFNVAEGDQRAFTMNPDDRAIVNWSSADWGIEYAFAASPGDLVAPVVSAKLKSKLRIAKIKKSVSITLASSEAATGTGSIRIPRKLPGRGHPKTKPGKSTITFATAKLSLHAGSNKVKLKLSKSGLRALKKLRGAGRSMRPVKATLKLKLVDPSGNAATVTKTFKLVVK
jgi:hypothetical protein